MEQQYVVCPNCRIKTGLLIICHNCKHVCCPVCYNTDDFSECPLCSRKQMHFYALLKDDAGTTNVMLYQQRKFVEFQ